MVMNPMGPKKNVKNNQLNKAKTQNWGSLSELLNYVMVKHGVVIASCFSKF